MLKKHSSVFITPILTMLVFLTVFALNDFFPFGNGLLSWCDMNQQTIPMINTYKDIFENGYGLFQNFNHAAGMNLYGVFFFFCASPFNILTLFVDKADIPQFMNILVIIKLSTAGAAASYFFSKRYSASSTLIKVMLGILYAFSGYGMLFYQNIIWLDIMVLFPLILLSCYILIENNKALPLIITLSAATIINYYLSFMLYLFLVFFFAVKLLYKKLTRETCAKLGIAAILSLLISSVVWIPSLIQYTSSARTEGLISSLKSSEFLTHYETILPVLLCSALPLCVVILSAGMGKLKPYTDKLLIAALMIIPIIIEPINKMWHTGNYMSFPVRYGFITVFLLIELCCDVINDVKSEITCKHSDYYSIASVILCSLGGIFTVWYTQKNLNTLSSYTSTLWGSDASMQGILSIFTVAFIIYGIIFIFLRSKKIQKHIFIICACLLILCESIASINIYVISAENSFDYNNYKKILETSSQLNDDSFYRVNMYKKYTDANNLSGFSVNALAHYTSLNSADYMEVAKMMGYSGYWMEINSSGGSLLSNALMGVKYTLKENGASYCFEENKIYPPIIFSNTPFNEVLQGDRLTALDDALSGVTGGGIVKKSRADLEKNSNDIKFLNQGTTLNYSVNVKEPTMIYVDCYNGFSNALVEPINNALSIYVNNNLINSNYPSQHDNGLCCIGEFENTTVNISINVKKSVEPSSFGVYGIDVKKFEDSVKNINGISLIQSGGSLNGEITDPTPKHALLSVPYKDGMKVTIGGKAVKITKSFIGLTSFNTNGLTGEIKITYTPKGFVLGMILSILGVLCAAIIAKYFMDKDSPKWIRDTSHYLFTIVAFVFIAAVYIFPIIVYFTK